MFFYKLVFQSERLLVEMNGHSLQGFQKNALIPMGNETKPEAGTPVTALFCINAIMRFLIHLDNPL